MSLAVPPDLEIPSEELASARAATRNHLGGDLEQKATDRFCVAIGSPVRAFGAGAVRPPFSEASAILEFADDAELPGELPAEVVSELALTMRERFGAQVQLAPGTAFATLLRELTIKASREAFIRQTGLIRDELERSTSALTRGWPAGFRGVDMERPFVQLCWLNSTIRTADARSISNVASDPSVTRVDVPRRIEEDQLPVDVTLAEARQEALDTGLSGAGVTVGVIDSEVALGHPAFQDRVIHRRNFTEQPWGIPSPHGTAVAGIIGARHPQYSGVAPDVTIYNYKVLGTNLAFNAADFEGTLAIQQALEDGVRLVNCSWGAGRAGAGTSREAKACDRAWRAGLTVVTTAGNLGPRAATLTTPADARGVIVVGATDDRARIVQAYSSRGPTADGRTRPHLVAPGGIMGAGLRGVLPTGDFGRIGSGTSFAAPHVTGLLALLLDGHPELLPGRQRERLLAACRPLDGVPDDAQGRGVIVPDDLLA